MKCWCVDAPRGTMATPLSSPFAPTSPPPPSAPLSGTAPCCCRRRPVRPPPARTPQEPTPADDDFDERVRRIKSRVGPKKRGARKKKAAAASASANAVTLREPQSALAAVGLAAVLLVELGSGQALVKYHQPATLFLQAYTVAAAAALFVKYEKERISTWPGPPAKWNGVAASFCSGRE